MTRYEIAYAYPSSTHAGLYGHDHDGCWLVHKLVDCNPPVPEAGPFENARQAHSWIKRYRFLTSEAAAVSRRYLDGLKG